MLFILFTWEYVPGFLKSVHHSTFRVFSCKVPSIPDLEDMTKV